MTSSPAIIKYDLSGSSKDRRKQFKAIQRKHPDCRIVRNAPITYYPMGDKRLEVEEANKPQTHVTVYLS